MGRRLIFDAPATQISSSGMPLALHGRLGVSEALGLLAASASPLALWTRENRMGRAREIAGLGRRRARY